jgi:hypothetical protein
MESQSWLTFIILLREIAIRSQPLIKGIAQDRRSDFLGRNRRLGVREFVNIMVVAGGIYLHV